MQDVLRLYGFALVMQFIMFITYIAKAQTFSQSALDVILRILQTLTRAAPPGLPIVIMFLAANARHRLGCEDLSLMLPQVLRAGANVDVVCFNKTGTLTGNAVSNGIVHMGFDVAAMTVVAITDSATGCVSCSWQAPTDQHVCTD